MATNKLTFEARVQALPSEIFEEIFNLTMTLDADSVSVEPQYKPPVQLSIDRAAREAFASRYYATTAFHIKYPDEPCYESRARKARKVQQARKTAKKWLCSLPLSHLVLLQNIQVDRVKLRAERDDHMAKVRACNCLYDFTAIARLRWRGTWSPFGGHVTFPWLIPTGFKINLLVKDEMGGLKEVWLNLSELYQNP